MIGKVKHPAVLLVVLICAMAAVPASADVLYDQIILGSPSVPGSYNVGGRNIYGGESVTDRFELLQDSVLDSAQVALWVQNRDFIDQTASGTLTSVDWAITSEPFGGTALASGTATNASTLAVTDPAYDPIGNIYLETISLGNLHLDAGTYYWLQLGNAVDSYIDPRTGVPGVVGWDDSSASIHWTTLPGGDATAYQFNINKGGLPVTTASEPQSFQILGSADTPPSAVPEPSSLLLMGTVLAGLGGYIRRKHLV
jgi:hypothetical protein